jgi:transcriptional regulator GlxA family with amidase domain
MHKFIIFILILFQSNFSNATPLPKNTKLKAYFFIYEGFTALDMVGPHQVLSSIMQVEPKTIALVKAPIKSDTGLILFPDFTISEIDTSEPFLLIIPGGGQGTVNIVKDNSAITALTSLVDKAQNVLTICTGALILAKTKRLNGHEATTHWSVLDTLSLYGATPRKLRYVQSGKFYSTAGVSAGIDGALKLTSDLVGENYAQMVQLAIEYDPAPPFNSGSPGSARPENVKVLREMYQPLRDEFIKYSK